jgi:hypothetical protein
VIGIWINVIAIRCEAVERPYRSCGEHTARTDRGHVTRQPTKPPISLVGPAVAICGLRAIEPPTRVIMLVNTDRTKSLQI